MMYGLRFPSLETAALRALMSSGSRLTVPSRRHHRSVAALATTRCGAGQPIPNKVVR
jgi:hypothetical protein